MTNEEIFLDYSCKKLNQQALRICECLDRLTDEQLWIRHGEHENAVGNLVLHLSGNVRQWIGCGVGGKADVRARDREFAARGDIAGADLKERLTSVAEEATAIIGGLKAARLAETTRVQNYEMTVLEAIYHVVEHFSLHAGQIFYATKLLAGADLGFYKHLNAPTHKETVP